MAHPSEWPDERGGALSESSSGAGAEGSGGRRERRAERSAAAAAGARAGAGRRGGGGGGDAGPGRAGPGAQQGRRQRQRQQRRHRRPRAGAGEGQRDRAGASLPRCPQGFCLLPRGFFRVARGPRGLGCSQSLARGLGVRGVSGDLERAPGNGRGAGRGRTNFPELGASRARRPLSTCFPDIPRLLHLVFSQYGEGGGCAPAARCPCAGDAF